MCFRAVKGNNRCHVKICNVYGLHRVNRLEIHYVLNSNIYFLTSNFIYIPDVFIDGERAATEHQKCKVSRYMWLSVYRLDKLLRVNKLDSKTGLGSCSNKICDTK